MADDATGRLRIGERKRQVEMSYFMLLELIFDTYCVH